MLRDVPPPATAPRDPSTRTVTVSLKSPPNPESSLELRRGRGIRSSLGSGVHLRSSSLNLMPAQEGGHRRRQGQGLRDAGRSDVELLGLCFPSVRLGCSLHLLLKELSHLI